MDAEAWAVLGALLVIASACLITGSPARRDARARRSSAVVEVV
jgi:hypothetical protein